MVVRDTPGTCATIFVRGTGESCQDTRVLYCGGWTRIVGLLSRPDKTVGEGRRRRKS
jgi:hypothetical protein